MSRSRDDKRGDLNSSEKRPTKPVSGDTLEEILGKDFASLVTDNGAEADSGAAEKLHAMEDAMDGGKKKRIGLVIFLTTLLITMGLVTYVIVDPVASWRVASFIRGDLLKLDRQRAADLTRQYDEQVALLQEKTGNIRLQYFPTTAKVSIIQKARVLDNIEAKEAKVYGAPVSIDNDSLHLKTDEELPELNIENLPIRERGKMCIPDGQFYPASRVVCPGFEKCLAATVVNQDDEAEGEETEGEASEAKPEAKKPVLAGDCNQHFNSPNIFNNEKFCDSVPGECKEACDCFRHTLRMVDFCPEDNNYYPAISGMVQKCPGADTLMDPTKVPVFIYDYSFIFEADDYLPSVVSYTEENWKGLGSDRYVILFPKDFSLLRDWVPVLEKFQKASKGIRCWDRTWEDKLFSVQREKVLAAAYGALEEKAKAREATEAALKAKKTQFEKAITQVGTLRKVKKMATVVDGRGEIFWFCVAKGQCEEANLAVLKNEDLDAYYGVLGLMDPGSKNHPELAAELAARPILDAGIKCLDKWMPLQARAKEPGFVKVTDPSCSAAVEALRAVSPEAYQALVADFLDPTANAQVLAADKAALEPYFKSRAEYGEAATPAYDDMLLTSEANGRHVEFMIKLYLFEPDQFGIYLDRFVKARLANHLEDAKKNNFWGDPARGLKIALEMAWWIGKPAFDAVYLRLWEADVQACLIFAKEHDAVRFEADRKRFQEMMTYYNKLQKDNELAAADFRVTYPKYRKMLQELTTAKELLRTAKPAFDAKYGAVLAAGEAGDRDLYIGLLLATNPAKAKALIDEMGKLPEVKEGQEPAKEGDQREYHKYLAFQYFLAKPKLEAGMKLLEKRVAPFFLSEAEYVAANAGDPTAPSYEDMLGELVNNDIPLKYFWLVRLFDNPSRFEREIARLDRSKTLLIAKSLDGARFKYLSDLAWLEPELDRDTDVIPAFKEWAIMDRSMLEAEKEELASWAERKAATERKFKRSKGAAAWLLEPTMVERALDATLKQNDRYALLMNNLEQYEESKIIEVAADPIREEGQAIIQEMADMWKKHGDAGGMDIRSHYNFTEARWSPLVDEVRISFPKTYTYMDEGLRNKRADCREPDALRRFLDCQYANAGKAEGEKLDTCPKLP